MTDHEDALREALAAKGYTLGAPIGLGQMPGETCDAETPSFYQMPDGSSGCRCTVCPRCGHHTGNSHQGHYWAMCKALAERVRAEESATGKQVPFGEYVKRTTREFHFCCGNEFGCELEPEAGEP